MAMTAPFVISTPGKVILFGEHSAVYGKPAIAAALSLRAYLLVSPSEEGSIQLDFPDIGLSHKWKISDIPWDEIEKHITYVNGRPQATDEIIPELDDLLSGALSNIDNRLHFGACRCFLYMYINLCGKHTRGMTFCIKSTLPIGAGLGSSAAISVSLATSMALLGGHIDAATYSYKDKVSASKSESLEFVDSWSLVGERSYHGNPSGIDNAVATYGGAILFQRSSIPSNPSVRTHMRNFPPINLLLTNTRVPRSTAALVGKVAELNVAYPKCCASILDAMDHLVYDAYQLMSKPYFGEMESSKLRELTNVNHGLLVALGVSHPELEKIKVTTQEYDIGATKLTGAGGGGCAITLVNEDVASEKIAAAKADFEKSGYEMYETELGGRGVGILQEKNLPDEFSTLLKLEEFKKLDTREKIEQVLKGKLHDSWYFW